MRLEAHSRQAWLNETWDQVTKMSEVMPDTASYQVVGAALQEGNDLVIDG